MYRKSIAFLSASILLTLMTSFLFAPRGFYQCWLTARSALAILRDEPAAVSVLTETVNFGTVSAGSPIRARFDVTNQGGKRLMLVREGTSCECIEGDWQLAVGPGHLRELVVAADSRGAHGSVKLTVRYRTNDPCCPVLVLTMLGTVVEDVASEVRSGTSRPIPSLDPAFRF